MKVKNSTMQAFPFIEPHEDENIKAYHPGISLRDLFAAKAMNGLLASLPGDTTLYDCTVAKWSYEMADAMLKARQV